MERILSNLIERAAIKKSEDGAAYLASQAELEKFAELVIQECAQQLEVNRLAVYDPNKHHEYWSCGVKWSVAKLRDYFAVRLRYLDCDTI
jgi:hypothetical protein